MQGITYADPGWVLPEVDGSRIEGHRMFQVELVGTEDFWYIRCAHVWSDGTPCATYVRSMWQRDHRRRFP